MLDICYFEETAMCQETVSTETAIFLNSDSNWSKFEHNKPQSVRNKNMRKVIRMITLVIPLLG